MKRTYSGALITGGLLIVLLTACEENKAKIATHPGTTVDTIFCDDYTRPSASFFFMEQPSGSIHWREEGLIYGEEVSFKSFLYGDYNHTWYVNGQVHEGSSTPSHTFIDVARPGNFTVSHVIRYPPNTECDPRDDGKDSVVTTYQLIDDLNQFATYGKFRGLLNHETDSFDIEIVNVDANGNRGGYLREHSTTWLINLSHTGDTIRANMNHPEQNAVFLDKHGDLSGDIYGWVLLDEAGVFTLAYKDDAGIYFPPVSQIFRGRKLE